MIGEDFEDDWRPIELSDSIKQYIKNNYDDLIDNVDFLPAEERPTPEGTGKEIVVFLGDGLDIIFDSEGNFQREINVERV